MSKQLFSSSSSSSPSSFLSSPFPMSCFDFSPLFLQFFQAHDLLSLGGADLVGGRIEENDAVRMSYYREWVEEKKAVRTSYCTL